MSIFQQLQSMNHETLNMSHLGFMYVQGMQTPNAIYHPMMDDPFICTSSPKLCNWLIHFVFPLGNSKICCV